MKYSLSSILISLIVIFGAIRVNNLIAQAYLKATGKTKALFGLTELMYAYKYYFLVGSLAAGILVWHASLKKEKLKWRITAGLFVLVSILAVVLKMWTWFV